MTTPVSPRSSQTERPKGAKPVVNRKPKPGPDAWPRARLSRAQRAEAEAFQQRVQRMPDPVAPAPDVTAAVQRRLAALRATQAVEAVAPAVRKRPAATSRSRAKR